MLQSFENLLKYITQNLPINKAEAYLKLLSVYFKTILQIVKIPCQAQDDKYKTEINNHFKILFKDSCDFVRKYNRID